MFIAIAISLFTLSNSKLHIKLPPSWLQEPAFIDLLITNVKSPQNSTDQSTCQFDRFISQKYQFDHSIAVDVFFKVQ